MKRLACALLLVACGNGKPKDAPAPAPPPAAPQDPKQVTTPEGAEFLASFTAYVDAACKCADFECLKKLEATRPNDTDSTLDEKLSPPDRARRKTADDKLLACMSKVTGVTQRVTGVRDELAAKHDAALEVLAEPFTATGAEAGAWIAKLRAAGTAACACTDHACLDAIKVPDEPTSMTPEETAFAAKLSVAYVDCGMRAVANDALEDVSP